jgi:ArsR family transcriptional regulator, arsenate/arsenite/antimonite-responsive transcriptional repressor
MGPRAAKDHADLVEIKTPPLPDPVREEMANVARALADPQRVEILHLLAVAQRSVCVLDLEYHLELAQSTVSHHLKVLVDAGLCSREPKGRWAYYSNQADVLAEFRHQLERLAHFPAELYIDTHRSQRE